MKIRFYICDVFTDVRFGGNQLAVLPDARDLSDEQMQKIAREFNFSETTFVLPPESGHTRKVRIFTPVTEMPFAGHPNVGTAFVLATAGELGEIDSPTTVHFEEKAGIVPVSIERRSDGAFWCELKAPANLNVGPAVSTRALAAAVSLEEGDIVSSTHVPQVASVGFPFVFAELKDRTALELARVDVRALEALVARGAAPDVHLYVHSHDDFDLRTRMFGPLEGVAEDPATGSANCALAAMLSHYDAAKDGEFRWRIAQGVEMGRPSVLDARAEKRDGEVVGAWIGGACVLVGEGFIEIG